MEKNNMTFGGMNSERPEEQAAQNMPNQPHAPLPVQQTPNMPQAAQHTQPTPQPAQNPYHYSYPAQQQRHNYIAVQKLENAFKPEIIDFLFALVVFVIGYIFSRRVLFSWNGWGVTVFTTLYILAVTTYLIKKGAFKLSAETIFWMAVTWLVGASYSLWVNDGFAPSRRLFLFGSAVYYTMVASGATVMGKTSNYLLIDAIKALFVIPFRNYFNQYVSFKALGKGKLRGKIWSVVLGLIIAVILLAIIIPLLESADAGGFGMITRALIPRFEYNIAVVFYIFISIPVAAYIYGLVSGLAHKKGTGSIKLENAQRTVAALRIVHTTTIIIVLGVVCVVYLVFILSQLPYFFSAFTGALPEGWRAYSEFARQGFFELCSIAAINLVLLTLCNILSKKMRMQSQILRIFNVVLSVITLVLIATAFSKMALYIEVFGLTMPRLLPCIFLVFLAIVFVALMVLQKKVFSIVRFSVVLGATIVVLLSLSNPDAMVVRYNAQRYQSGTLSSFDVEIAWRAGVAGVLPAIEVYNFTENEQLKEQLQIYLMWQNRRDAESNTTSFESARAWRAIKEDGFSRILPPPDRYIR